VFDEKAYTWASYILDSRSIWWNGGRHLTPLLDFINCRQGPAGHNIHSTQHNSRTDTADTNAPWSFRKGEQVFENYGQPNHIYLRYHGFSMSPNDNDCVLVDMPGMAEAPCLTPSSIPLAAKNTARRLGKKKKNGGRSWEAQLAVMLKTKLQGYATTAAEDSALLDAPGSSLTDNARSAITFRRLEKNTVNDIIKSLDEDVQARDEL
jgi:hypothetical protein